MGNFLQPSRKITYSETNADVLGEGSNGTKVYRGKWENQTVAVKRIVCEQTDMENIQKEINILIKCDSHKNVVRYFDKEVQGDFIVLALELCEFTLEKWVEIKGASEDLPKISRIKILEGATEGINYLHSQSPIIIHRDIKPQNILLRVDKTIDEITVKISDFGICKILPEGRSCQTITGGSAAGTDGWMAPEILRFLKETGAEPSQSEIQEKFVMTKSTDIFSLGCVFYYVLTWGNHPYGVPLLRNGNILVNKSIFDKLDIEHKGFTWLLKAMTSKDIEKRPPSSEILKHHIFWSKEENINFLEDISNSSETHSVRLENCITSLEARDKLFQDESGSWWMQLCPDLRTHLTKKFGPKAQENKSTVMKLIRLIRNMHNHILGKDVSSELKMSMGVSKSDMYDYWITRFPYIVTVTWIAFQPLKKHANYALGKYYSDFNFEFGSFK
ncbi:unnamed protein product [Orchesella dallaii]|uniref:Uncharacterized protein n=1 Tax=Orchesella dallaii TaxID=48710 RepID=A0ABP1PLJ4_9HEXA